MRGVFVVFAVFLTSCVAYSAPTETSKTTSFPNPTPPSYHIPKNNLRNFGPIPQAEAMFIFPIKGQIISNKKEGGIFFRAYTGQEISAVKSGKVSFVGFVPGQGNSIIVKHTDGFISYYAYLSEIFVELNEVVKQGQIIGKVGQIPTSVAPQFYFRLYKHETSCNPLLYLK